MQYILEDNEGILQQHDGVSIEGGMKVQIANVILTSKYLVIYQASRANGKEDKEVAKLPLTDIRIFQHKPQAVLVEGSSNPKLVIYFTSMTIEVIFHCFKSSTARDYCQQWISSLRSVLCEGSESVPNTVEIPGETLHNEKLSSKLGGFAAKFLSKELWTGESAKIDDGSGLSVESGGDSKRVDSDKTVDAANPAEIPINSCFCGECGKPVTHDSKFCKWCGARLL